MDHIHAGPAMPLAPSVAADPDTRLPPEVAGAGRGWLWSYRNYPIFSRPWTLGRIRTWGLFVGIVLTFVLFADAVSPAPGRHPVAAAVSLTLVVLSLMGVPVVIGPLLGWQIRRLRLRPSVEYFALVVAMVATLVLTREALREGQPRLKAALIHALAGPDAPDAVVTLGIVFSSRPKTGSQEMVGSGDWHDEPMHVGDGPWWERTFTYTGMALMVGWFAGAFGILGLRRERLVLAELQRRREAQAAQLARREAEMQLSVLQAQVEPHFLFNTLAGVRGAISGDPQRAVEIVDRLVDYLRAAIPRLRTGEAATESTLRAQTELVRAYLALMRSRIPRLSYDIDLPAELADLRFPPWMLISLAENAIKHGVEPKIGPARVWLQARRVQVQGREMLEVSVSDDGVGFGEAAAGTGIGLANIRQRLAHLYGSQAELALRARPEGGAVATIRIPREMP